MIVNLARIKRTKMKPIQNWLDEYAESHQNPANIKIHWICVPLIMLSIIGLGRQNWRGGFSPLSNE